MHPLASPPHHLPSVSIASYQPDRGLCHLHCPRGKLLHTMSHHSRGQHLLHMEEALYLLERGLLELLLDDVPVTVQECYALLEADGGSGREGRGGLDAYVAYAELKAQGWVVLRPSALYREKRTPAAMPLPPTAETGHQQETDKAAVYEDDVAAREMGAVEADDEDKSGEAAPPARPPSNEAFDSAEQQRVGWTQLEWGCADNVERDRSTQLLQFPILDRSTDNEPWLSPSLASLLSSLPLFLVWPPSAVGGFRRSSPPCPSHLLLVSSGTSAEEGEQLIAALQTAAGVAAVWQRGEREMCGVDGEGERVAAVRGVPVLLATVQLTRVAYLHFQPLRFEPHRDSGG